MVFECGRCKVASVGTGNGHLRGTGRKQLCLGPGMGLGGEAGSSQVEGLEIRQTQLA